MGAAGEPDDKAAEIDRLSEQAAQLRVRVMGQVASLIRAGVGGQVVRDAVAQVEAEIAQVERRRDELARWQADAEGARERVSDLERQGRPRYWSCWKSGSSWARRATWCPGWSATWAWRWNLRRQAPKS